MILVINGNDSRYELGQSRLKTGKVFLYLGNKSVLLT